MKTWTTDSLQRHYPRSEPRRDGLTMLEGARGESLSFQAVCRTGQAPGIIKASLEGVSEGLRATIRLAGLVPVKHLTVRVPLDDLEGVEHLPGFVPDPLLPQTEVHAGPNETHVFWVTIKTDAATPPGDHCLTVRLEAENEEPVLLPVTVRVHPCLLPKRDFPVTHFFYADSLCGWYGLKPFEEALWPLISRYLEDMAAHGQDIIYTPLFTPPLDGVKSPTQLLGVSRTAGGYSFDWSLVERWVKTAQNAGLDRFEWVHLFPQWGAQYALPIYEGRGETGQRLWPHETAAVSEEYRSFLTAFLPEFERFLRREGLMEKSYFHLSDEPGGDQLEYYRQDRAMLRELAPWMRVMDALSELAFAREGLTEMPVPLENRALDFLAEGFPAWTYFCCLPRERYLNHLLDTPLVKIRMSGWLFYRTGVHGFLHWGYNYWQPYQSTKILNPFFVNDAEMWPNWPCGDPFMVYPGPDGPIDSLRWEVFAESLQDYALLQGCGLERDDPMLEGIRDFADFPRDAVWITANRSRLLKRLDSLQD